MLGLGFRSEMLSLRAVGFGLRILKSRRVGVPLRTEPMSIVLSLEHRAVKFMELHSNLLSYRTISTGIKILLLNSKSISSTTTGN